ncbi:MAG: hypothetical protein WCT40_00540 [Candidatus Magasanikbacteria bacterium]
MEKYIVPKPNDSSLVAQLVCLYKVFKDTNFSDQRDFDISNVDWFYPLLILPLSAHINCYNSRHCKDENNVNHSYLNAINFPYGVDSVSVFQQQIQAHKSYIPISILKKEKGPERERLESLFSMMVYSVLGSVAGAQNAVHYPITELVTNIFDHSKQDKGFIFGQFYPKKNYLDICIVDCGRGLAKTYEEEKGLKLSDADSIVEVLKGHSTKPSVERGYGVRTSKKVVCECLGGEFVLLSGSSALVASGKDQKIVDLPGFYWQGVVVAYRIPKPLGPVDISPYLE